MSITSEEIYRKSQKFVRNTLIDVADDWAKTNQSNNYDDYILAMMRKGPRSLEALRKGEYGQSETNTHPLLCNVTTEIAIPFLFNRMRREKKNLRLCVYDDAIYYGTTFIGINEELNYFKRIYQDVAVKKIFLASIKATEAKRDLENIIEEEIRYYGKNGQKDEKIEDGFGHYFVKRLTSDIRSLHTTFEVEFPIMEYILDEAIEKDRFFEGLKKEFGEECVYEIKHDENVSYSVVMNESRNSIFEKLRFFPDETRLKVVCFAPRSLPFDKGYLNKLFSNDEYGELWDEIVENCQVQDEMNADNFDAIWNLDRPVSKSLMVLANYLFSYSLFVSLKDRIGSFLNTISSSYDFHGVEQKELYYLTADHELCKNIKYKLNDFYNSQIVCKNLNYDTSFYPVDHEIYENTNQYSIVEKEILDEQNVRMIENSNSQYEALSAMFFNQKALIEKWADDARNYNNSRLRFGYTIEALNKQIKKHCVKFQPQDNFDIQVHQWIDLRIDQGSVVPQYIVNPDSKRWYRVFRPGENEDAFFNHIARYVLFVYKCINDIEKSGFVDKSFLEDMVCVTLLKCNILVTGKLLCNEQDVSFTVKKDMKGRKMVYKNRDGEESSLVDLLLRMYVLKSDNGLITVSQRSYNKDLISSTTLGVSKNNEVQETVKAILGEVDKNDLTHVLAYEVFNKYYYECDQWNYSEVIMTNAIDFGETLLRVVSEKDLGKEDVLSMSKYYLDLLNYIIGIEDWNILKNALDVKIQEELVVMKFIYDLILVFFYSKNLEYLKYTIQKFEDKIKNNKNIMRKFQHLLDYCNAYKYRRSISEDDREEICKRLYDSIKILKSEHTS